MPTDVRHADEVANQKRQDAERTSEVGPFEATKFRGKPGWIDEGVIVEDGQDHMATT